MTCVMPSAYAHGHTIGSIQQDFKEEKRQYTEVELFLAQCAMQVQKERSKASIIIFRCENYEKRMCYIECAISDVAIMRRECAISSMLYINQLVAHSSTGSVFMGRNSGSHGYARSPVRCNDRGLSSGERLVVVPCAVIRHRQQRDNPGGSTLSVDERRGADIAQRQSDHTCAARTSPQPFRKCSVAMAGARSRAWH